MKLGLDEHRLCLQVRLRHENVERMRQRIGVVRALYRSGAIDICEVRQHLLAWVAHARHGHTQELLRAELSRLPFVREEGFVAEEDGG